MPRLFHNYPAAGIFLAAAVLLFASATLQADVNKVESLRGYFTPSPDRITLLWTNPSFSGTAAKLSLYRKELYSDFILLTNLPTTASTFVDTSVSNFKFYTYKIATITAAGTTLAESETAEVSGARSGKYDLIRFIDNTASLSTGGLISFYYSVTSPGETVISVLTPDLATVRVLEKADLENGTYKIDWDCRNGNLDPVIPGLYIIAVGTASKKYSARVMVLP